MRHLALLALLLACSVAHAQAASSSVSSALGWTSPTQYVDNSALPASQISGTAVYFGPTSRVGRPISCPATPTSQTDTTCYPNTAFATGSGNAFTATFTITQSTTMYFAVATKGTNGALSDYSGEASKSFTVTTNPTKPNAPTTITITITLGACVSSTPGTSCTITSP